MDNIIASKHKDDSHINLVINDTKFKRKGNTEEYKLTRDKKFKSILNFDFNKCCYCSKVFLNPTFLIKHLIRRHSDKQSKTQNVTESDCNSSYKDLLHYNLFQNVLETMKYFNLMNLDNSENKMKDKCVPVQEEINDLKTKFSRVEENMLRLEEAFDQINSELSVSEDNKIYNKLRERLLEFQSSALQNSESNLIYTGYISDLRTEIERLELFIKANSEKIDYLLHSVSSEVKKELEIELKKRLERDSTMFLSNMENEKYKSLKDISKNPVNISKIAPKKKRHKSKSLNLPKQSFNRKAINANSVESPLEEKLNILSILADIERLSTGDYDTKMRCVHAEKEALCHKYSSFSSIRNNLDSYADELVLSKLKDRKSKKKLRFLLPKNNPANFESEIFSSNINLNVCTPVCYTTKKKEIQNSSASLKLFDYQNNCKLSDTSYNTAEELSPVSIFELEGECENARKRNVVVD